MMSMYGFVNEYLLMSEEPNSYVQFTQNILFFSSHKQSSFKNRFVQV